jgi:hypothetical protein
MPNRRASREAITIFRVAEAEIDRDLSRQVQSLLQICFPGYPNRSYSKNTAASDMVSEHIPMPSQETARLPGKEHASKALIHGGGGLGPAFACLRSIPEHIAEPVERGHGQAVASVISTD